jgi:hypothetical protein
MILLLQIFSVFIDELFANYNYNYSILHLFANTQVRLMTKCPYNSTSQPGSSGSIVSDYGLDDRAIGDRYPAGAKDFSSNLCVQTGSGAHPTSCTRGTGGSFPRG